MDQCHKLKEISYLRGSRTATSLLDDSDMEYIVKHLKDLRRLKIATPAFTGSSLKQIGQYAKKLEYLHMEIKVVPPDDPPEECDRDMVIGGGQLPSLKQFYMEGHHVDNEDWGLLFESVICHCPNITHIAIQNKKRAFPNNMLWNRYNYWAKIGTKWLRVTMLK